jgi:D-amino-acid dehydrogenase
MAPWLVRYLRGCTPQAVERVATALAPLLGESLEDHRALAAGTGAERYVVGCDYVYLYRDRAAFAADAFGWGVRQRAGITWTEQEGAAFAAAEPVFARRYGLAVRLPRHGRITDPGAYVRALAAHVERAGGTILRGVAEDAAVEGGRVRGVVVDGAVVACSDLVVAAGAWSGGLAARLGVRVPMESERGYHLELWDPDGMPSVPVMLADAKTVVTPMEGRIRLAGLVEFGGLRLGPSEAPLRYLRRQAAAALPGVRWAREEAWMGHRPAPADSVPVIGPVPGVEGAWLGFGHHHVGLTAGAATGRLLAQAVTGRRANIDLAPYAPARFQ